MKRKFIDGFVELVEYLDVQQRVRQVAGALRWHWLVVERCFSLQVARFAAVVVVDFVRFVDSVQPAGFAVDPVDCVVVAVDPSADFAVQELAAVHRIVASSAVDVAERESRSAADIGRSVVADIVDLAARDTVGSAVEHDTVVAAAAVAAHDIAEQHSDDNFVEFRSDVELDNDSVRDKKLLLRQF